MGREGAGHSVGAAGPRTHGMTVERVLSRPECGALVLLFAIVFGLHIQWMCAALLLRKLGALNFRAHEWLRPSSKQHLRQDASKSNYGLAAWRAVGGFCLLYGSYMLAAGVAPSHFVACSSCLRKSEVFGLGLEAWLLEPLPVRRFSSLTSV